MADDSNWATSPMAGPFLVPRHTTPLQGRSRGLLIQANTEEDPDRKAELQYMSALEQQYATDIAEAQDEVQEAALDGTGDIALGSASVMGAKMRRQGLMQDAARQYRLRAPSAKDVASSVARSKEIVPITYGA